MKRPKHLPTAGISMALDELLETTPGLPFEIHCRTSETDPEWAEYVVSVRAHEFADADATVASGHDKLLVSAIRKATENFKVRNL